MAKQSHLSKALSIKHMGPEPKFTAPATPAQVADAYNWYVGMYEHKDAKAWTLVYFKAQKTGKAMLAALAKLPDYKFITLGWQCRMLSNGAVLPDQTMEWMKTRAQAVIAEAMGAPETVVDDTPKAPEITGAPVITIQDRIWASASSTIGDLEIDIDTLFVDGKTSVDPSKVLKVAGVKAPQAKLIAEYYKPFNEELILAISGKDAQVTEGYKSYTKPALKKFQKFLEELISACGMIVASSIATRKPRKTKVKSAEQMTSKVKYKMHDPDLSVDSVHPSNIVRSESVWLYNAKTRKLAYIVAKAGHSLNIKGTTILDFDEKASMQKKLRKPGQTVPQVIQAGKVSLRRLMENIKSKSQPVNGRINGDTLILKAIK